VNQTHPNQLLHLQLAALRDTLLRASRTELSESAVTAVCDYLEHKQDLSTPADPELESLILEVRRLSVRVACSLEKQLAGRLALEPDACLEYFQKTSEFARLEGHSAELDSHSKVLFVGGGSLPVSALTLARTFGCQVTSLDHDLEACRLANHTLAQAGMPSNLEIRWGKIARIRPDEYTHIWIASLVSGKEQILSCLSHKAPHSTVVVRYANDLRAIFNFCLDIPACFPWLAFRHLEVAGHLHDTAVMRSALH